VDEGLRIRTTLTLLLISAAMLASGCRAPTLSEEDYPPYRDGVVGPVPGAEDVRITLETDGTVFPVGESVTIYYRVENRRKTPLFIYHGGDYRGVRQDRFRVTATRRDGVLAPDPFPGSGSLGGRGMTQALWRGQPWYERFALSAYCQITTPGTYVVRVFHDLGWGPRLAVDDPRDGEITLTFVEPTAERRQAIVDSIPEVVTSTGSAGQREAWPAYFAHLRNPVYLPELERRVMTGSRGAVIGIANIASSEATAALLRLTASPADDVADMAWLCLVRRCPSRVTDTEAVYYNPIGANWLLASHDFGDAILDLWPPETMREAIDHAREVLHEGSGRRVAFAAQLLALRGEREDFSLLVAALDRELARDGGKDLGTEWSVEWGREIPMRYLLGACFAMVERGAKLPESSRTPAEQWIANYIARIERGMR